MGYHEMAEDEWWAFLRDSARPAVLSTVREGSQPRA